MMNAPLVSVFCLSFLVLLQGSEASPYLPARGGASTKKFSTNTYYELALALEPRLQGNVDVESVEKALKSLSSAQKALKAFDGAAHEAYQRTHSEGGSNELTSVSGRARRSAARIACTADAFLAAELCELIESDNSYETFQKENSTLEHRSILLKNVNVKLTKDTNITLLVLWEPSYEGGAGVDHGGIKDLVRSSRKKRGRVLVILKDPVNNDLNGTFHVLDVDPIELDLQSGLVTNEVASVHPLLYRTAGRVLRSLIPTLNGEELRNRTDIAIHFVGRSLAGGVAGLAAVILDGSLPMPEEKRRKIVENSANETKFELEGFGRGRSSAMVLGTPPCLSANVKATFVKSVIFGDDVVCRASKESIERLCHRTERALKGGILGRRIGWMSDVLSLTVTSMKSHARGSEGEEGRLVVPGQAFLIRPRRLGGVCSMHEVGGLKGGREALRAAVLWQLNDVLLSNSLWKHHQLEDYIQGLDKVHLRGVEHTG